MRKIEFRGKAKNKKCWVYGNLIHCENGYSIIEKKGGCIKVKPETIGQYIGLKDKNGTKIFEGDILVFCKGATHPIKVYWDCLGWKFLRNGKRIEGAFECNISSHIRQCEIIGNIYDNPELVEKVEG